MIDGYLYQALVPDLTREVREVGRPAARFHSEEDAQAFARTLADAGSPDAKVAPLTSTSWQVRTRTETVGQLTKTFKTKAEASQWAKEKAGEIAKRELVDYRTADQTTLGELLLKYEEKKLSDKPAVIPTSAGCISCAATRCGLPTPSAPRIHRGGADRGNRKSHLAE